MAAALALGAAAGYASLAAFARRIGAPAARGVLIGAWLLHGAVLLGAMWDEPRFGFAPALSVTAWFVLAVYLIEGPLLPELRARWMLALLGAFAVLLALAFPGTPTDVAASAWLPLHWAFGIAAYGLFACAVLHAWLMRRAERDIRQAADPHSGIPLLTMERLTFRFVTAGFVLLTATLAAGALFGETLYGPGHAWRWNHKTIFSVLSWLTFAVLLLGRSRFGWRGRTAVQVLYAGSALLLLAYVGSRFVLEVVLGRTA